jgi:hypothetical protein
MGPVDTNVQVVARLAVELPKQLREATLGGPRARRGRPQLRE